MDYILADRFVVPEDDRRHYSEQVVYLPESYMANHSRRVLAEPVAGRAAFDLPQAAFVFCCFNNGYKIDPEVFDAWMRLLQKIEGSVLWLSFDNSAAEANLRREAADRGVNPSRLVFARRLKNIEEHYARYRLAGSLPGHRLQRPRHGERCPVGRPAGADLRRALVRGARGGRHAERAGNAGARGGQSCRIRGSGAVPRDRPAAPRRGSAKDWMRARKRASFSTPTASGATSRRRIRPCRKSGGAASGPGRSPCPPCLKAPGRRCGSRNDLRLVGEDLAAAGVDRHLEPVHVVVPVALVVAEGFHAREVLQPAAQGILERLVDPEIVRVAVHVRDRLAEGDHFVAQGDGGTPGSRPAGRRSRRASWDPAAARGSDRTGPSPGRPAR